MNEPRATNLDELWIKFDPYDPLPASSSYYVQRPDPALLRLRRDLLRKGASPPKIFYTGLRGAGKSTELNRLIADEAIRERYVVIDYRIGDVADPFNLSHVDILFSMGAQIFNQYTDAEDGYGGSLPDDLIRELEGWRGRIEERVRSVDKVVGAEGELSLNAYFLKVLARSKAEESSRREIRQLIEPRLSELIETINLIIAAIAANEKEKERHVLVVIDDLDKPPLETAKRIFHDYYTVLMQPACAVIYTVPAAIFFAPEFTPLRGQNRFLPNLKLHPAGKPQERFEKSYETLRDFFSRRADRRLITDDALEAAATSSGGVFREMARIIRTAADLALEAGRERIETEDVAWAEAELRNEFVRILRPEDYDTLKAIHENPRFRDPQRLAPLLHCLAALEYHNHEIWYGVHPAVIPLLEDDEHDDG